MDSADYSNYLTVSMVSNVGSPPLMHEGNRLASLGSTSHSPARQEEYLRDSEQGAGIFMKGFDIFSTILSYFLRFCSGGYRPYIKQAERDIDRVADFIEEGARLVVKLADEIEAMAQVAELTAQEAEDLALKVEAKTKKVKQTLDAIADVLEGDKKLSTVLTNYATVKKEAAVRETAQVS